MLVFSKQSLVFLATPKTASTAIEKALGSLATIAVTWPAPLKHTDAAQFVDHLKPYLQATMGRAFRSTALMREPRDWLGSWYRNRKRDDEAQETSTQDIDFDAFVRLACSDSPPEIARVGHQSAFLAPRPDVRVDHIFRYDRLDSFVHFLEDQLNFEILLPRLNVSPLANMQLSDAAQDLIRRNFADDFALYRSLPA